MEVVGIKGRGDRCVKEGWGTVEILEMIREG